MKTKMKKTAVVLMSLIMVMCYMPMMAFAGSAADCDGGESCSHEAAIAATHYDTLKEAVEAAQSNETIVVLKDVSYDQDNAIVVTEAISLDLNGQTISYTTNDSKNQPAAIHVKDGGTLTIKDSTVADATYAEENYDAYNGGKIVSNYQGISVHGNQDANTWAETSIPSSLVMESGAIEVQETPIGVFGKGATFTMKNGYLKGIDNFAVAGNGLGKTGATNNGGTVININGGVMMGNITSSGFASCGIYHPQSGVINITGGTIISYKGPGVVMRNGTLNVTGGTITAKGEKGFTGKVGDKNYDLTTCGIIADYEDDAYNSNNTPIDTRAINVSGGTIKAENNNAMNILKGDKYKSDTIKVTGGTFLTGSDKSDVSSYFPDSNYSQDDTGKVSYNPPYVPTPTPTPDDNVTSNPGDKTTTADVETSTGADGKATATVDKTTADKIVDKAVENKSEEVIIDATTKGDAKTVEVSLPAETVKSIIEKTDADVVIKTDAAEVVLDQKAAEAVADQAKTGNVTIVVDKVKEDDSQVQVELKVVTDNGNVTDFKGGSVKVTVALPAALKDKEVVCVYIDEKGSYTKVSGVKNADGTYTFTTGHFSTYAVMTAEEADKVIKEQEKSKNDRLKAGVKATTLKASSTAKKGSISIKWKKSYGYKVDYFQVFRSTKKDSGYGTKAFYTTKSGTQKSYKNTKQVKKGTRYYYKVRGVRTIDGVKVYTKWSSKAIRTAK